MNLEDLQVEDFLRQLKEKGYAKLTITSYRTVLKFFMNKELTKNLIQEYQAQIQNKAASTRLHYLTILRNFLRATAPALVKELVLPRKERRIPKEIPSKTEVKLILQKPDLSTFKGVRDRALLEVLYSTGIRKQELINLKLEDIQQQVIRINQGKMGKDRLMPISAIALKWLKKYIEEVRSFLKPKCNYVFMSEAGNQMAASRPFKIVKQYSKYSCHKYRHSFATHLLQNGMKETSLQRLLGHAQISTTQIYTQVTISELRRSYRRYHDRDHWRI